MKRTVTILLVVVALIAGAVGVGWLYFSLNPQAWDDFVAEMKGETTGNAHRPVRRAPRKTGGLVASGTIEVEAVSVASEMGGRIVEMLVDEGDAVAAGDVLVELDKALLLMQRDQAEASVAQAQAALDAAQAQLALAESGARPQEIAQAEGSVAAVQAALEMAQGQAAAAEAQLDLAQAGAGVEAAQVITAQAGVETARAGVAAAQAQLDQAQATLDLLRAGARPEEIAALEANVAQAGAGLANARAVLKAAEIQIERTALTAPVSGIVIERLVRAGELASPGAPLLTLADLDQVTLTVYVPEADLDRVALGQEAEVTVDAYEEVFAGRVSHIASRAEFTPKNVQTQEERVHMVFAVKIRLENADHRLKPGMPADAAFQ